MNSLLGWLCHQMVERSPACAGETFPLCYRCAGTYLGALAAYVWLRVTPGRWRRRFPDTPIALGISFGLVPWYVDGLGNALDLWATPGWLRAATGVGVGTCLPMLVLPLIQPPGGTRSAAPPASAERLADLAIPLALALVLVGWLCVAPTEPAFRLLAWLASLGCLMFWANLLFAGFVLVRDFIVAEASGNQ